MLHCMMLKSTMEICVKHDVVIFLFNIEALQYPQEMSLLGLQPGLTLPGATGLAPEEDRTSSINTANRPPVPNITDNSNVECCLQECPEFIHYELMQLFTGVTLAPGELRVLTLCERTVNDMTGWSQVVEEEREQLLEHVSLLLYILH